MRKGIAAGAVIMIGLLAVFLVVKRSGAPEGAVQLPPEARQVAVYKSSTCGCCTLYVDYLRDEGFTVAAVNTEDMGAIKERYGIPEGLESCHTTIAGGYFVEGHVPMEALAKLLAEKPAIRGIALPGMPSATPGMPGSKTELWDIHSVGVDGQVSTFMRI